MMKRNVVAEHESTTGRSSNVLDDVLNEKSGISPAPFYETNRKAYVSDVGFFLVGGRLG